MSEKREEDELDIYKSAGKELEKTLDKQLEARTHLKNRSIDLLKVDILIVSIIITGITASDIELFNIYLVASMSAFIYAMWAFIAVFKPRKYARGISHNVPEQILANSSEIGKEKHYKDLMKAYKRAIEVFNTKYPDEKEKFTAGLYASLAGILYSILGLLRHLSPSYFWGFDVVGILIVFLYVFWAKN